MDFFKHARYEDLKGEKTDGLFWARQGWARAISHAKPLKKIGHSGPWFDGHSLNKLH